MVIVTADQMRALEGLSERLGVDAMRLMENAGAASVMQLRSQMDLSGKQVLLLCGRGNNGGDVCVMARHLLALAGRVTLVLTGGIPATPQASEMYDRLRGTACEVLQLAFDKAMIFRRMETADLLIDGMYGIGFHGKLSPLERELAEAFNRSRGLKAAIDLPSGWLADTGEQTPGAIVADCTVVLGAYKPIHLIADGKSGCGKLLLADIGIPQRALELCNCDAGFVEGEMVRRLLPKRQTRSHKGDHGRALVVCGSLQMSGAAVLATKACLRGGAGLTTLATVASLVPHLAGNLIENTFLPLRETAEGTMSDTALAQILTHKANAMLIGCGLGQNRQTTQLVKEVIRGATCPLVVDADALSILGPYLDLWKNEQGQPVVLTPHPGEMARLTGKSIEEIQADRNKAAKDLAEQTGYVVVLKGAVTVIAAPGRKTCLNMSGNAGLAKGGSGDVLAGLILALLAQGMEAYDAAVCAVWLHGHAADLCAANKSRTAMLATDLIETLPQVFLEMEEDAKETVL